MRNALSGRPALALGLLVLAAIGAFALVGPLGAGLGQPTAAPATLLAHPGPAGSGAAASPLPYTGSFHGTLAERRGRGGSTTMTITGPVAGSPAASLVLVLDGEPLENGGVAMTASRVTLRTATTSWTGQVLSLHGPALQARLSDGTGRWARLELVLQISGSAVSGNLTLAVAR